MRQTNCSKTTQEKDNSSVVDDSDHIQMTLRPRNQPQNCSEQESLNF